MLGARPTYEIQDFHIQWKKTYPVRCERQPHALQLASWLAEAEVVLFRLWYDEVQLDVFPKQQVGECEGMQGWLVHLNWV